MHNLIDSNITNSNTTNSNIINNHNGREIAAIDLGSNSFHMIIARILNGSIQVLSTLKQKVQLAEGLDENYILSQDAINRGIDCLALFAERLHGFEPANVKVVGTYTLRQAVNNQDFLQQAENVFPFPIHIISGQEEARLIYSGVSHTQPETTRKLIIDIGGGSTEMIIGDHFEPIIAESRDMGCVSFAKNYFKNGKINEENFKKAKQAAMEKIEDLAWEYRQTGWQNVLGSSGTIKSIAQVIISHGDKDGIITVDRLNDLINKILKINNLSELKLTGLNEDRADVFVPGLAILSAVFDTFKIERMRYSDGALREGVMYGLEQSFQVKDIRERTVNSLAILFNIDLQQANRVRNTIQLLFSKYTKWQQIEYVHEMQNVLFSAAYLFEVGIVINHNGVQKHSAYILQNSDLPGFDSEQQKLLSCLVRYHIKSIKIQEINDFIRYDTNDVLALLRLLRLAIIINKSRQATEVTEKFTLDISQNLKTFELQFEEGYLDRNPLLVNDLEAEQTYLTEHSFMLTFK